MASKSHLLIAHDPLLEGELQISICGVAVPDAIWTFRFIPGELNMKAFSTLLLCPKCVRLLKDCELSDKSYVYGAHTRNEKLEAQLEESA